MTGGNRWNSAAWCVWSMMPDEPEVLVRWCSVDWFRVRHLISDLVREAGWPRTQSRTRPVPEWLGFAIFCRVRDGVVARHRLVWPMHAT